LITKILGTTVENKKKTKQKFVWFHQHFYFLGKGYLFYLVFCYK